MRPARVDLVWERQRGSEESSPRPASPAPSQQRPGDAPEPRSFLSFRCPAGSARNASHALSAASPSFAKPPVDGHCMRNPPISPWRGDDRQDRILRARSGALTRTGLLYALARVRPICSSSASMIGAALATSIGFAAGSRKTVQRRDKWATGTNTSSGDVALVLVDLGAGLTGWSRPHPSRRRWSAGSPGRTCRGGRLVGP